MSAKKTKTLIITQKNNTPKINIAIDDTDVEQVTKFAYL